MRKTLKITEDMVQFNMKALVYFIADGRQMGHVCQGVIRGREARLQTEHHQRIVCNPQQDC